MDLGLEGRVALVTGGSRGIGFACARALAREGCRVAISARSPETLDTAVKRLAEGGGEALAVPADLSEPEAAAEVARAVADQLGPVDILVNNAGAIRGGSVLTSPVEDWVADWQLKIVGYIRMVQAVLPSMQERGSGRIVNIAGTAARNPSADYMAGGLANAGLVNWTRSLADLAAPDGILVTAVSPGPTATERWDGLLERWATEQGRTVEEVNADYLAAQPLGRLARPEDVADLVTFLVSERATFLTGICITVDGGASRGVYL